MSDGGYSRIEKDFLGNERMVHYDASGNMLGASDVIREPDGTMRILNDDSTVEVQADLPKVEAVMPKATANSAGRDPLPPIRVRAANSAIPFNRLVMILIGVFVGSCLLTLLVYSFLRTNNSTPRFIPSQTTTTTIQPGPSPSDAPRLPDRYPDDPKPRNDDPAPDPRPTDQTAPDSNMDDNHPRIQDNNDAPPVEIAPRPGSRSKKGSSDDPIDLRGDDGKKDPKKGDPGADPLKGDDIH